MARQRTITVAALLLVLLLFPLCAVALTPQGTNGQTDLDRELQRAVKQRSLTIAYRTPPMANASNKLLEHIISGTQQEDVESLTVNGFGSVANWTLVASVLSKFPHLGMLHWQNIHPPPPNVLAALVEALPGCKLFWKLHFDDWDPFDKIGAEGQVIDQETRHEEWYRRLAAVGGSTNLYSLRTDVEYGSHPDTEDMRLIQMVVQGTPNLRELDLSLSHSGCVVSDGQPRAFDFSNTSIFSRSAFPTLKVLRLSGYDLLGRVDGVDAWWHARYLRQDLKWPYNLLPGGVLDNIGWPALNRMGAVAQTGDRSMTNLDAWKEKMDWSHLETLELDHAPSPILPTLLPILNNLTSFKIDWADEVESKDIQPFLAKLPQPLSNISLSNVLVSSYDDLISTIITHHNTSLLSLNLHERDDVRKEYCFDSSAHPFCSSTNQSVTYTPRPFLNSIHLSQLQRSCPSLTHLALDIDRLLPPNEINTTLSSLSQFSSLSSLNLHFQSLDFILQKNSTGSVYHLYNSYQPLPDDQITHSFALQTFKDIRNSQSNSSSRSSRPLLKELNIHLGNWESRYNNDMITLYPAKKAWWKCHMWKPTGLEVLPEGIALESLGSEGIESCDGIDDWDDYVYGLGDIGVYLPVRYGMEGLPPNFEAGIYFD